LSHPAVSEAVCFAVPDELYGQEIHAAIVVKEAGKTTEKELREFVATKAAKFKVPKKVSSCDATDLDLYYKGDSEDGDREDSKGQSFRKFLQTKGEVII
jgi:acyl-CoA synthetase (AMP-forming)/AMP-acid ligase II